MGVSYRVEEHIILPYENITAQEIIASLKTRLTVLKIQEPTLEDAYIEYINKEGIAL
jgi:ABC-2 type transport system ATP-binding protein